MKKYILDLFKYNEINNPKFILIDLRKYEDYKKKHLKNAINLPYDQYELWSTSLSKSFSYILYCYTGVHSLKITIAMKEKGYDVYCAYGLFEDLLKIHNKKL